MNFKRLSIFLVLAMLAGLVSMGSGARALAAGILVVDRGLPTGNLNNISGSSRSNVAWAESYDNSTGFTGDDFTVGSTGEHYTLNTIRTWVVADRSIEGVGYLGDKYSNVRLFLGTGASNDVLPVMTGNLGTGSDTTDNPSVVVTLAHYSGGATYQGTSGTNRNMYQIDFNNLNITVQGGQTIKFGVWGLGRDDGAGAVYAWSNHASNAGLSVSTQQGADDYFRDYGPTGLYLGSTDSNGHGWDKSSDLNVQVYATQYTPIASTPGTWALYPAQATTYQTSVQQPINADGSSIFRNNGVIPVKFALSSGVGPVVFESILTDNPGNTANDYSALSFTPTNPTTFNDIATLKATYAFTTGNCYGGSLRWSVAFSTGNVFIYYGAYPNFTDCSGANSQSGTNMIGLSDLRYDTSQIPGGTFYDNYAHAQTLVGTMPIIRASLVLDGGWGGDQRVTLTSASVNDNTWTAPPAQAPAPTCNLPQATIRVTKLSGTGPGGVLETTTIQPADNNALYRVVDCKYMYNLATSSLTGTGYYEVEVLIGGNPVANPAYFTLR